MGSALSTHWYEMSYPEVLRIVRGYLLTEAICLSLGGETGVARLRLYATPCLARRPSSSAML